MNIFCHPEVMTIPERPSNAEGRIECGPVERGGQDQLADSL